MQNQKCFLERPSDVSQGQCNTSLMESVSATQLLEALNLLQNINKKGNCFETIRQQQVQNQVQNVNISFCQNSISFTSPSVQNRRNINNKEIVKQGSYNNYNQQNQKTQKYSAKHTKSTINKANANVIEKKNKGNNKNNNKMKFQFYMSKKTNMNQQKNYSQNKNKKTKLTIHTPQSKNHRMSLTFRQHKKDLNNKQVKNQMNLSADKFNKSLSPLSSRNTVNAKNNFIKKNQRSFHENTDKNIRIKTQADQTKKSFIYSNLNINKSIKFQKKKSLKNNEHVSQCSSSIQERTLQFLKNKNEKISKIQQAKKKQFEQNVQKQCTFKPKIIKNWKRPVLTQRKKVLQQQFVSISKIQSQQESLQKAEGNFALTLANNNKDSQIYVLKNNKQTKLNNKEVSIVKQRNSKILHQKQMNICNKKVQCSVYKKQQNVAESHKQDKQNLNLKKYSQQKKQKKVQENYKQKLQVQNSVRKHQNQKFNILLDLIH